MKITTKPLAIFCLITSSLLGACNDNAPENKATPPAENKASTAAPQPSTAPQPTTAVDKAKETNQTMENTTTEKKEEIDKPK